MLVLTLKFRSQSRENQTSNDGRGILALTKVETKQIDNSPRFRSTMMRCLRESLAPIDFLHAMKKYTGMLLFAIFLATPVAMAQLVNSFALKVGVDAATQSYEFHDPPSLHGSLNTSYRWGFAMGGELGFFEFSMFTISAEVLYIQKGYSILLEETSVRFPEGTGDFITIRPRVDYVSMASIARIKIDIIKPMPYVLLGPRLDIPIGKNESSLDLNSPEFGATLGAGVEVSFESFPEFFVESRFSPSFTNAFRGDYLTVKNKSFEMLTGIRF